LKKHFLAFYFLLMVPAAFCKSVPIAWSVSSQKHQNGHYLITVKGIISKGWYVYAEDDTANQITAVDISWDNSHVVKAPGLKKTDSPESKNLQTIHDKISDNRPVRVYNDSFQFIQPVEIEGAGE